MPDSHRNPLQTHITRPTPATHHHDLSRSFCYSGRFPPTALRGGTPSTPLGKQNGPGFRSKTKCTVVSRVTLKVLIKREQALGLGPECYLVEVGAGDPLFRTEVLDSGDLLR